MSRSPRVLPSVLVLSLLSLALSSFPAASAQDADQLWADFAHYVRIASPELAGEAAAALSSANPGDLLDAVEASDYNDPNRIFQRAAGMEAIAEVAAEVQAMIQIARLERSREPERIAQDITTLSQGHRAYNNAIIISVFVTFVLTVLLMMLVYKMCLAAQHDDNEWHPVEAKKNVELQKSKPAQPDDAVEVSA